MEASEVFNLFKVQETPCSEHALRKAWLSVAHKPCKDVVALAFPLKPVPCTLEGFRQLLADSKKDQDFVITNWYVIYVGLADGREWGWNKAPYDSKKKLPSSELKSLYTIDSQSGESRFWSFKKVPNNINKGPRIDEEGEDLSFVLPAGTCFSVFLREDNYETSKGFFCGDLSNSAVLSSYSPVILQLSSTNCEQAAKGNGLKLRKIMPIANGVLNSFFTSFFTSKADLEQVQTKVGTVKALSAMARPTAGCPFLCKVDKNAFPFYDKNTDEVELCESGVDPELGSKLFVKVELLLKAVHSADISRALRMLTLALAHGAVTCLVVPSKRVESESDACDVVHLNVDLAQTMLLHALQQSKIVEHPTNLPSTSFLTMCFGDSINARQQSASFAVAGNKHLQWYSPSQKVPVVTSDGREVLNFIVFEMELCMKQCAGQREEEQKVLLMDEVAGLHYVIKAYYCENVELMIEGLVCENPRMLVTWQLLPGLGVDFLGNQASSRKRQYLAADETDEVNCGGLAVKIARSESKLVMPDLLVG